MRLAALVLLWGCLSAAKAFSVPGPRDWLLHMVSECVDTAASDYCDRCLKPAPGRCGETPCADLTVVWASAPGYVALRDRKMCGCPEGFVHGLALPRLPVKGVEDSSRPAGLWAFAWEQALAKIGKDDDILLAVNGPQRRTQDQLHVHLMRLRSNGRKLLNDADPERVENLDAVWDAAARHAKRLGVEGWYGVAVAKTDGGFWVTADGDGHPETRFGQPFCR